MRRAARERAGMRATSRAFGHCKESRTYEPTPFHEGLWAFGRRLVSWLPGLPLRAFPSREAVPVAARFSRAAAGIPGHSGGSASDSHRLPLTTGRCKRDRTRASALALDGALQARQALLPGGLRLGKPRAGGDQRAVAQSVA